MGSKNHCPDAVHLRMYSRLRGTAAGGFDDVREHLLRRGVRRSILAGYDDQGKGHSRQDDLMTLGDEPRDSSEQSEIMLDAGRRSPVPAPGTEESVSDLATPSPVAGMETFQTLQLATV